MEHIRCVIGDYSAASPVGWDGCLPIGLEVFCFHLEEQTL